MNRGLFERDKMTFKLMVTLKILVVAGTLSSADVSVFLKVYNLPMHKYTKVYK